MTLQMPHELATERLVLRAASVQDAPAQVAAVAASFHELARWLPWCTGPQDLAGAAENLQQCQEQFERGVGFEYVLWLDGAFAGRIGVHAVDARVPKGEIGYWTSTPYAGRGLMQEAVRALTDALLGAGFVRVEIRCDALNQASARVARACGYRQDACLVNDAVSVTDPGERRDTLVFSTVVPRD